MDQTLTTSGDGLFDFETHHRSDVGCVRAVNEDSVLVMPASGLWLVADGMGGHAAGDYASQTIVSELATMGVPAGALDLKARFLERLARANTRIYHHACELGGGAVGSTIAALLVAQDHFACIWSGDSRVYRMRGGSLSQVTRDHTEVQALLDAGTITKAEAEAWPRKNVITRAIGVTETPECDMVEGALAHNDLFLICSDGLTEYFNDTELEGVLNIGQSGPLSDLSDRLVNVALERGGKDNVSVVLVRCTQNPLPNMDIAGIFPEYSGLL